MATKNEQRRLFALKVIHPSPFRNIDRYPIRQDKITALRDSLRSTGYWGNVLARVVNGVAEIAYGHHRLEALKAEYGPDHEVELIVRELSDEAMLKIMVHENMQEWDSSAAVEHETIRAVVEAFAAGRINLPAVGPGAKKHQIRHAPSFVPGRLPAGGGKAYTARTLAAFIGWCKPSGQPRQKVHDALSALHFIEEGVLKEDVFAGLTTKQAQAVIAEAERARKPHEEAAKTDLREAAKAAAEAAKTKDEDQRQEAERRRTRYEKAAKEERVKGRAAAAQVGRSAADEIKSGRIGYRAARKTVPRTGPRGTPTIPEIEHFCAKLMADIHHILHPEFDRRCERLDWLLKHRKRLKNQTRKDAVLELQQAASRFLTYSERLEANEGNGKRKAKAKPRKRLN